MGWNLTRQPAPWAVGAEHETCGAGRWRVTSRCPAKVKSCVQASSVRGRKESLNSQLLLETCVLRASDQFRLQELLYVQQFKIMASKRRATIIL
jgi:hypothetical protein